MFDGKGSVTNAKGIEVIDARTLRLTIDAAKPYFLAKLTYPTAYVVKKQNVDTGGADWTKKAVGTGPFKLEEYRIGERLVLARNENFWGRKAFLDRVTFNLAGGVAMAMYENDEVDITGVGLLDIDRVKDPREPLNKELVRVPPGFSVSYIGLNTSKPPFDDLNFRKALNHAIDKELIASEVYGGLVLPAYAVLPPDFPGYTPDISGLKYDPELAKEYLQKSKYADAASRPRIVITVPGTGGSPTLDIEVVTDMWEQTLGVKAEIQQVEWATYLQDLNRRRLQAFGGLGWEADYPDPQDFLDILFHSDSDANHGGYKNPQVDQVLAQARTESDSQKRTELYHKAEQLIVEDAAWVPMWFDREGFALVKPWIKGFKFTPLIVPKLKDVWIDKS
ncbi:MAG: peptide ABC transporter substrate-binding protein [Chloroflexi bacterium]|nr:peptide ABC transporter substrate-binding protein [Chloroflexota bacterium]